MGLVRRSQRLLLAMPQASEEYAEQAFFRFFENRVFARSSTTRGIVWQFPVFRLF